MDSRRFLLSCVVCVCASATTAAQAPARAQKPTPPPTAAAPASDEGTSSQWKLERISATHMRFIGQVEYEHPSGVKFFADQVDLYSDKDLLVATGNVVFTNLEGRISAENVEFNTREQTGTFYQASGIMSLGDKAERVQFGGQDPDVYFYGEKVEKIGQRKYRITKGGFTTCVQPTPRWELTSGSVVLEQNDYAFLRNTVLRVKGVPVFYLPALYYPIQEDQRSTGFLLPSYGASSLRGQSISNAFFWAISRSQDATLEHNWFTRTGQGYGGEYRYVAGAQSDGNVKIYRFSQKEAEFRTGDRTSVLPAKESFEIRANATQAIARGLRARSHVDYFSDIVSQQLYHQNLYDASRRMRIIAGAVSGAWGLYNASLSYDRNEIFTGERSTVVYGNTPRASAGIAPTRLFGAPVYASMNGEFTNLPYRREENGVAVSNTGLTRLDVTPLVRVPVSRWTFLTLNTSAGYRLTRYSESLNALGIQVPEPFTRSFLDVRMDAIGPVFSKIWDAAADSRVERYKHVIEPAFGYQQITPIEGYRRVPTLSNTSDFVVGGVTRFSYGLTNRVLRRDRPLEGSTGAAREFLSVSIQQTYYSDTEASRYDPTYASSVQGRAPVDLSPIALTVRYAPTISTNATLRAEHDVSGGGLQSLSGSGGVFVGTHSANVSISSRKFDRRSPVENYFGANGSTSFLNGRVAATYSMSWDITRHTVVSQTMSATYFAQCCGLALEFQNFNYPQISSSYPIPADRRINFSFTLAGLGTFSNFFGAFGGNQAR